MRIFLILGFLALVVQHSVAPPVTKAKKDADKDHDKDANEVDEKEEMEDVMEYHRYLKEVVQALESDPEFRQKLEKAEEVDIRTGKIAHELEYVNHQVRSKLDELKRQELERLRHLAVKEYQLENGLDPTHLKIAEHLDHANPHTFEIDDLKKLIAKTTQDLAEADQKRREEFKEYEMQKKFEQEQQMKGNTGMDEEQKEKYTEELHNMEEKHKKHQPLHHPGSKQQLEEVWEKQDHMDNQEFDPRTFFYLHDLDGNGVWDQNEVKALFLKELDKLYAEGAPEDDLRERAEEMERMREHVFNEADLNKDGLISYHEFLEQTRKPDFQQDNGWQGLDEQQIYSQQEYEEFERRRQEEIQKLIAKGVLPPHPASYPSGHPQQFPPQYGNVPIPQGVPGHEFVPPMAARGHPNQISQGQQQYQGQHVPQQQYQGQGHPVGQVPQQQQQFQGQVHPAAGQGQAHHAAGQVPQQQQYQGQAHHATGQVPQQQQYQGQAPPAGGNVPQQQQYQAEAHPAVGQVPQQQQFQGQVPPQQKSHQANLEHDPQQQDPNSVQQPNAAQQQRHVRQEPQQQQNIPQQQNLPHQQQNVPLKEANIAQNAQNKHPNAVGKS